MVLPSVLTLLIYVVTDGLPSTLSLTGTTIGTVSFPFDLLPFPRVLYHHVLVSMTRTLLSVSIAFDSMTHTHINDSTCFYILLYCSIPRTCILGFPPSLAASKPSSLSKYSP